MLTLKNLCTALPGQEERRWRAQLVSAAGRIRASPPPRRSNCARAAQAGWQPGDCLLATSHAKAPCRLLPESRVSGSGDPRESISGFLGDAWETGAVLGRRQTTDVPGGGHPTAILHVPVLPLDS